MKPNFTRRGYRTIRPSKAKRSQLTDFYKEIFTNRDKELPAKTKNTVVTKPTGLVYTDKSGKEITLNPKNVKSYGDTDWFSESGTLFPQLGEDRRAMFGKQPGIFGEDGYPSLTSRNIIVLDVVQMTKGDYGPWYLMHVLSEGDPEKDGFAGEFTIPTRGGVVNETIEALSGIALATGKRIAPGELPVALRVEFAAGEGDYEGYYYTRAPLDALEEAAEKEAAAAD